jgi:hypothetical protein
MLHVFLRASANVNPCIRTAPENIAVDRADTCRVHTDSLTGIIMAITDVSGRRIFGGSSHDWVHSVATMSKY